MAECMVEFMEWYRAWGQARLGQSTEKRSLYEKRQVLAYAQHGDSGHQQTVHLEEQSTYLGRGRTCMHDNVHVTEYEAKTGSQRDEPYESGG